MTTGEKIKAKRIELGLTQDELAKRCGYKSRSSINKLEVSRDLSLKTVGKIAEALGCDAAYLVGWEDDINEESGSWAAEYITDKELFDRVTRIQQASPELRNKILSMIDIMLGEE